MGWRPELKKGESQLNTQTSLLLDYGLKTLPP